MVYRTRFTELVTTFLAPSWVVHNWAAEVSLKQRNGKKQKGQQDLPLKPGLSQATIDTQAREAIKDLFPNIPPKDLHDIVTHAFEVGKSRVGTASELSLPRRVQLAVVAHIRHTYTDYDKLLKQIPYQAARALIEQPSLDKLAQWRGDDEDEPDAMEEILREVIVIDDDDEETNTHSNGKAIHNSYGNHQGSVEIISSRAIGDNMETRPIDYGKSRSLVTGVESPESDDDQEVTFLGHGQYVFDKPDQARHNREGAHRLRAWEEARTRFRHPFDRPPPESSRVPPESLRHADGAFDEGNSRNISGLQLREYRQPNNQEAGYLNNLPLHRESAPNTTIPHGLILQTDHRNTISSKQVSPRIFPSNPKHETVMKFRPLLLVMKWKNAQLD
ncbi:hypothetical protein MMC19_006401 [Ptychographa xylographoides]|nr:hypothetical protein [Ptychographa xylographoides]